MIYYLGEKTREMTFKYLGRVCGIWVWLSMHVKYDGVQQDLLSTFSDLDKIVYLAAMVHRYLNISATKDDPFVIGACACGRVVKTKITRREAA